MGEKEGVSERERERETMGKGEISRQRDKGEERGSKGEGR